MTSIWSACAVHYENLLVKLTTSQTKMFKAGKHFGQFGQKGVDEATALVNTEQL